MLVAIDGSCADVFSVDEEAYDRQFENSFVRQLAVFNAPRSYYARGPSLTGKESRDTAVEVRGKIEEELRRDPNQDIFLAGYSRGGAICIEVAHYLKQYRSTASIKCLALFDAVDRAAGLIHTTWIPGNVSFAYHARRDPKVGSRDFFGNCGLWISRPGKLATRFFFGTHAALGGIPWTGDHPSKSVESAPNPTFEVGRSGGGTTASPIVSAVPTTSESQDKMAAELVKSWMWENIKQHGML